MKNPLFEHLFKKHENSEKTFLSFVDGTSLTYGEYIRMIYEFSSSFRAMGLKPGDRISLKIEKSQYFLVVYGACIHSGLIFLPINDKDSPPIIVIKIIVKTISIPGIKYGRYVFGFKPLGINLVEKLIKNLLK